MKHHRRRGRAFAPALLLLLVVLWRCTGAPVLAEEWASFGKNAEKAVKNLPENVATMGRLLCLASPGIQAGTALLVYDGEKTVNMGLEAYTLCCVAGEMPAGYQKEALKAQAVCARTYAVYRQNNGGCPSHPGADVCTNASCCQAFADKGAQEANWGGDYEAYYNRVSVAVKETAGQIMTYENEAAMALYHADSGGQTESALAVFGQDVPYLQSVSSPGEEKSRSYQTEATYPRDQAAEMLNKAFPGAKVTGALLPLELAIVTRTASGRAEYVQVGEITVTGRQFREGLGLKSTNLAFAFTDDNLLITAKGYGHGVGMSQDGANAMAAEGADYKKILNTYYAGVEITEK